MHPIIDNFESHIRTGNRDLHEQLARCLDLTHDPLMRRPYPKAVEHWTGAEFVAFLDQYHFPPNTYKDRQAFRLAKIRDALAAGDHVPEVVLAEEGMDDVIQGAILSVRSSRAWTMLNQQIADASHAFEQWIGYHRSLQDYTDGAKALLKNAFQLHRSAGLRSLIAEAPGYSGGPVNLTLDPGLSSFNGHFGKFGGREKAIVIRAGTSPESVWSLFRLHWQIAEPIIVDLLNSREVTYDQVWMLTGVGWTAPQRARVDVIRSEEAKAA